jgi:Tol biopolymer transport system component
VVAVVAVVILAIAGYFVWQVTRPLTITASNPRQVTFDPGREASPVISPDGSEVAYVVRDQESLYVQSLSGGSAREVAPAASIKGWSSDGQRIFFGGWPDGGGTMFKLQEVGKLGGPPSVLAQPNGFNPTFLPGGGHYSDWRVAAAPADSLLEIVVTTIGGGIEAEEVVAVIPGRLGRLSHFSWSPDGERVAWVVGPAEASSLITDEFGTSSIWVAEAGGEPVRVTDDNHRHLSPVWFADSRHLLFISDRDGPRDIYLVDAHRPGEAQRVTFGEDPGSFSVSADGSRLAYTKHRFRRSIWEVPIPATGTASIRDGRPITTVGWNQLVMEHDLSPAGDSLVFDFRADPSGEYQIYKMAVEGGPHIQLSADSPGDYGPVFSPDGREIAFLRDTEAGVQSPANLWVMDSDGANARQVAERPGGYLFYDWSSDGLTIVYEKGRDGLWAVSRDSMRGGFDQSVEFGEPEEWSDVVCHAPRWAPDGSSLVCNGYGKTEWCGSCSLFWLSPDGRVLKQLDPPSLDELEGEKYKGFRKEERAPTALYWMRFPRFSPDGSTLYFFAKDNYTGAGGLRQGVWSMPATGGEPRMLVNTDDEEQLILQPKADGQGYGSLTVGENEIYLSVGESEVDVWVLDLDW